MFFSFDLRINPTQEDYLIKQYPFLFQFVLRILQKHFNDLTNKVENISSPAKKNIQKSARKSVGVSVIIGGGSQFFYTSVRSVTGSNQPTGYVQNPPTITSGGTPKMSVLF